MARTLTIKKGDTQKWEMTLKENGSTVNVSGATAIVLYMRQHGGTTNVIDGEACTKIDDGSEALRGRVDYSPDAAEVNTVDWFDTYVRVTWADGTIARFPSNDTWERAIHVTENLE